MVGFDIERHRYPARAFALPEEAGNGMSGRNKNGTTLINAAREQVHGYHTAPLVGGWIEYPAQLVIQDVLTLHGSQFKDAALIVASPPCQAYSYRAMPWKKAKALPPPDNTLFEACFRIQREACEAAGHHISLVVENVCGAQKWVGRARWHYGSYYLWGDVPALMPIIRKHAKVDGFRFDGSGRSFQTASVRATKNDGGSCRKAASAMIAKIPLALSRWVARSWYPVHQFSVVHAPVRGSRFEKTASAAAVCVDGGVDHGKIGFSEEDSWKA